MWQVVPIRRADWLSVLRGALDPQFWQGDAQPDGPAFKWYLDIARRSVESSFNERLDSGAADARVVLVGHSAGELPGEIAICRSPKPRWMGGMDGMGGRDGWGGWVGWMG